MIEWPFIFLGGLLGSSHCIGMCGAFAVTVGVAASGVRANLCRQSLYSLGRIFTYAFLGAVAGNMGMRLARLPSLATSAQAVLAIAAGILLVGQGLHSAGFSLRRIRLPVPPAYCPAQGLFASFLTAPGWQHAFFSGILTGFLPCGLVYAYLALAAGTGSGWRGAAVMGLFGAGTVPLMALTGIGASLISRTTRRRLLRLAACCVICTGAVTIWRGVGWARPAGRGGAPACPFCSAATDTSP